MVYTKIIIYLSVGESGGYLPPLRRIIVNYSKVTFAPMASTTVDSNIHTTCHIPHATCNCNMSYAMYNVHRLVAFSTYLVDLLVEMPHEFN